MSRGPPAAALDAQVRGGSGRGAEATNPTGGDDGRPSHEPMVEMAAAWPCPGDRPDQPGAHAAVPVTSIRSGLLSARTWRYFPDRGTVGAVKSPRPGARRRHARRDVLNGVPDLLVDGRPSAYSEGQGAAAVKGLTLHPEDTLQTACRPSTGAQRTGCPSSPRWVMEAPRSVIVVGASGDYLGDLQAISEQGAGT